MKKLLITTAVLAAMTTTQALADFGSGGAVGEAIAKDKAGKAAAHEAKQNALDDGATDAQAERAAAKAEQEARDSIDTNDSPVGRWIENN